MGNCNSSTNHVVGDDVSQLEQLSNKKSKDNNKRNKKNRSAPNKSKQYPPKITVKQQKDAGSDMQQIPSKKYAKKLLQDSTESSTLDADVTSSSIATLPLSPLSPSSLTESPIARSALTISTNETSRSNLLRSHQNEEQTPDFSDNSNAAYPLGEVPREVAKDDLIYDRTNTQQQISIGRKHHKKTNRYTNGHHPAGRALQGRLQRAQKMQHVLSSSDSIYTNNSSSVADYVSSGEEESVGSSVMHKKYRTISSKYSTMSNASVDASINSGTSVTHDEIETTLSKAAVWAEINVSDPVLCTCISRTRASLSKASPPIHIAVGTSNGTIHIQELLNGDEIQLNTSSTTDEKERGDGLDGNVIVGVDLGSNNKLGKSYELKVSGKVRSMDFSTDGKYLAVGGDSGTCTVYRLEYGILKPPPVTNGERSRPQPQNIENDEYLMRVEKVTEIHRIDRIYAVQFSPDCSYLAIGGFDGAVAIIAVKDIASYRSKPNSNKQQLHQIEPITEIVRDGLILTLDWSPDSRYLAIGGSDKCCAIVNTSASWKVFKEIRRATSVQSVQWYPGSGRYLAIGSCDVAVVVGRDSFTTITEIDIRDDDRSHPPDVSPTHSDRQRTSNTHSSVFRTNAVCWSPNGSYFAICGSNNKCTIVETQSFGTVHEISRAGNITCAVWQQQNQIVAGVPRRYLAIGAEDNKVVIMKAGIEVNPGTSSMADDYSNSAASSYFSPRGDWVLREDVFSDMEDIMEVSSADRKVKSETKMMSVVVEQVGPVPKENMIESVGSVLVAIFSKGSKTKSSLYFACAADDGLVSIRFVQDWRLIAEIQFPQPIQSMAFSNGTSNRYLALGGVDSNVYVSDTTANFSIVARIVLTAPVTSVTFCKNNERLAAGSQDGTFAFLDPSKSFEYCGEIEARCNVAEEDEDNESSLPPAPAVLAVDWCSKNMAIGRDDGTVTIYDAKQILDEVYNPVATIIRKAAIHSVSFGVSSRFLAVAGADNIIGIYSSKGSWVLCHQVQMINTVAAVRWSPVGRYLACGSVDGTIKVIDTIFWADVEEAAEALPIDAVTKPTGRHNGNQHRNPIKSLTFSQDGRLLAVARPDIGATVLNTGANWAVDFRMPLVGKAADSQSTEMNPILNQNAEHLEASSLSSLEDENYRHRPPQPSSSSKFIPGASKYTTPSHANISFSEDEYYPPASYTNSDNLNQPCEV